jgi:hypothetical protein
MIKAFKFCVQGIFSLLEKTHSPLRFTKFELEKFFSFYIISTQMEEAKDLGMTSVCVGLRRTEHKIGEISFDIWIGRKHS